MTPAGVKLATAAVLFALLGLEITLVATFFSTVILTTGLITFLDIGVLILWNAGTVFTTGAALATVFVLALDRTGAFTTADLAGVTATAEAQIVTLPPFTWEPNLLDPNDPPEFLQPAKLGEGATANRLSMIAKPTME
ncbi:MAG: hypothetical protein RL343_388 [Actinomycetota bacterium]